MTELCDRALSPVEAGGRRPGDDATARLDQRHAKYQARFLLSASPMNRLDPLSGYADPRLYVALDTGERALAAIGASLMAGRSPVLLSGPCGIGKTLLLRVLAEREWSSFPRVRFSPSLAVEPDELAGCLLYLLFGKRAPEGREAEIALLTKLRSPVDQPTLLLVDNIHRASVACVHKLAALTRACTPALAVVVTGTDGPDLRALTSALSPEVTVSLPESLPELEIEALYESILAHPGLSQRIRYRLAGVERAEVVRAAAGFPRLLRSELVRRTDERPSSALEPLPVEIPRPQTLRALAPAVIAPAAQTKPDRAPRPRTRWIPAARQAVRAAATHLSRPVMVLVPAASALPSRLLDACVSLTRLPRTIGSAAARQSSAAAAVANYGAGRADPLGRLAAEEAVCPPSREQAGARMPAQ